MTFLQFLASHSLFIIKTNQHCLDSWLLKTTFFFGFCSVLTLRFRITFKVPLFITSYDIEWENLDRFQQVKWCLCLHEPFYWSSANSCGTKRAQTFLLPKSSLKILVFNSSGNPISKIRTYGNHFTKLLD